MCPGAEPRWCWIKTETEAGADPQTRISVYTLMKLLGHESMATSQRYVISAGSETKAAAAQNPLCDLAHDQPRRGEVDPGPD